MKLYEKATRGGLWYAAFSLLTQAVSWASTFYVIRLLQPEDYGLMTMAAFLTAYLQMFSEFGLGSAIVQSQEVSDGEVNSIFWFSALVGFGMGCVAFLLAYPTSWLFHEPRVVPVTQLIAPLFLISSLTTVPYNLLARQFELKKIAMANLFAGLLSAAVSVTLALQGFGVYTLIFTNIVLNTAKMLLLFRASGFKPRLQYSMADVRPFLSYGIYIAMSSAALRLVQFLDKLVVGRLFGPAQLGLYGSAMTLSSMPIDKIWPIYQQVSFPLFARLQTQMSECYATYLAIARHYLVIVAPIYVGALIVAPELISVVLGQKWVPMVPMFQMFCVVKLFEVLTAYHCALLNAIGRQRQVLLFHVAVGALVPAGMYVAGLHSFAAIMLPWLGLYPLLAISWLVWCLRSAGLSVKSYAKAILDGTRAAFTMGIVLAVVRFAGLPAMLSSEVARLAALVVLGGAVFGIALLSWQRELVANAMRNLRGVPT